jgi:hypothetical protein
MSDSIYCIKAGLRTEATTLTPQGLKG